MRIYKIKFAKIWMINYKKFGFQQFLSDIYSVFQYKVIGLHWQKKKLLRANQTVFRNFVIRVLFFELGEYLFVKTPPHVHLLKKK